MLNIAEGSGRLTNRDKRTFYVISRGSTFESVAILDYLHDTSEDELGQFQSFYKKQLLYITSVCSTKLFPNFGS
ncbi:MAG: four helix bundle protein [Bacteroidota bacterium]